MDVNEATKSMGVSVTPEYKQMMESYISILEKTNQQLSVWSNPYGIAIGILSLFIAVIAIGVAIALWRHSKEQKDRFNQFLSEQEKIIQLKNERLEQVESKLDRLIKGYNKQLESATKDNKKEIEKAIADLEKEKASIGAYITPAFNLGTVSGPTIGSFGSVQGTPLIINTDTSVCSSCGRIFSYSKKNDLSSLLLGNNTVPCSYCGKPNMV